MRRVIWVRMNSMTLTFSYRRRDAANAAKTTIVAAETAIRGLTAQGFPLLPKVKMPQLPKIKVPSTPSAPSPPKISVPKIKIPKLKLPKLHVPNIHLPSAPLSTVIRWARSASKLLRLYYLVINDLAVRLGYCCQRRQNCGLGKIQ
jgi:hypothetical protein